MAYHDEVVADGPLVYIRCDDPSGVPVDEGSRGITTWFAAINSPAEPSLITWDGGGSYGMITGNYMSTYDAFAYGGTTNDWTAEMWVQMPTPPGGASGDYGLFQLGSYDNASLSITQDFGSGYEWVFQSNSEAPINFGEPAGTYFDGLPHHVVLVYSYTLGTVTLYLDGLSVGNFTISNPGYESYNTNNFALAGYGSISLVGDIDECAVYDYALSADRVHVHNFVGRSAFNVRNLANYSEASSSASSKTTGTLSIPADSLVFVLCHASRDTGTWSTPAITISDSVDGATGWAAVGGGVVDNSTAFAPGANVYAKYFSSSTSRTITVAGNGSTGFFGYDVVSVEGADTAIVQATNAFHNWQDGGSSHIGSVTLGSSPTDGNLVLYLLGVNNDGPGAATLPTDWSRLAATDPGGFQNTYAAWSSDTTSATVTIMDLGDGIEYFVNWGIELQPAGSGGPTPAALSGTSAAGASSSGSLKVPVKLSGTSAAAAASSGSLTASSVAALSGTSAAAGGSSGALTASVRLSGTSAAAASSSGLLNVPVKITGTSAAAAASAGGLRATNNLSGTSAAAASAAGGLRATNNMTGSSPAAAGSSGNVTVPGTAALSGTSAASAGGSGLPNVPVKLSGSSAALAGGSGALKVVAVLSGSSGAAAGSSGALKSTTQLAGSSAAQASSSGAVQAPVLMSGSSGAAAASAAALTASAQLSGASTAQAGGTGRTTAASALSGSSAAAAGGSGGLQVPGSAFMSGASAAQAGSAGSVTASSRMTGASAAAASSAGQTTVQASLSGSSPAGASGSGLLSAAAQVSGSSNASATGSGSLRVIPVLLGTSAAAALSSGGLRTTPQLLGLSAAAADASGGLAAAVRMVGASPASADASGLMTVTVRMAGSSNASAGGSATITIGVKTFDRFAGGGIQRARSGRVDRGSTGTITR